MKRLVALMLAMLLIFSMVACGTESLGTTEDAFVSEEAESKENQTTEEKTEEEAQTTPGTTTTAPITTTAPATTTKAPVTTKKPVYVYNNPSVYEPGSKNESDFPEASFGSGSSDKLVEKPEAITSKSKYGTLVEGAKYPTDLLTEKLTLADVKNLPIANDSMTNDELRQLALDYFRLQLSFQWTPNEDVLDYPATYIGAEKTLEQGNIYGGIPYQSTGTGNLYRWLEYYDENTGIFYLTDALNDNGGYGEEAAITDVEVDDEGNTVYKKYRSMQVLFNQCSVASFWGWGRSVNSASFAWTSDMNVYNGFIPVGFYTYGDALTIDRFGVVNAETNPTGKDTRHVIQENGGLAFLDYYAQMKPGDCLVSGGHAMMVQSVDTENMKVTVLEQVEPWSEKGKIEGVDYFYQGGVENVYSYLSLYYSRYLPFTFAEFHRGEDDFWAKMTEVYSAAYGEDEAKAYIEGLQAKASVEKAEVTASGATAEITVANLQKVKVVSNYPISDVFLSVRDTLGNETNSFAIRSGNARVKSVTLSKDGIEEFLKPYTGGTYSFVIRAQISTGEKLDVFTGTIS